MRILIYNWRDIAHPNAGGAEVYTDRVASEWVKLGHEVTLFASAVDGQPEVDVVVGGYRVVRRGSRHGVYREARKFWVREGRGNFDLVVDEVNTRPFGCPRYVKEAPVIALIHQVCQEIWGYETRWPISWFGRHLLEPYWLSRYRSVPVVTVSESSKDSLLAYGLRDVTIVPEGSALCGASVARPTKEAEPTLVFVGRLSPNKRPGDAIEVHRSLSRRIPNLKLWMIGSGPEEARLKAKAAAGVTFYGRCDEATKKTLVARAHILLATSVREGWGLVVTEAAEVGTIACAYDVPGLRESVLSSGGLLSGESASALANVARAALVRVIREGVRPSVGGVISWEEVSQRILSVALDRTPEYDANVASWLGAVSGEAPNWAEPGLRNRFRTGDV